MGKDLNLCAAIGVLLALLACPALAENQSMPQPKVARTPAVAPGKEHAKRSGAQALEDASQQGKYAFVFFYRDEDARTKQRRTVFDATVAQIRDRAESLIIRVDDPSEAAIVDRYKVRTAPMPFVFVVAPNGAVVHTYQRAFSEKQLLGSFVSSGMETALKSLQDGRMTFLCIQNGSTRFDTEAMKGVNEFRNDPKYSATTKVIKIDPRDAAEAPLLKNLKVDPKTPVAVTVLLAPPGNIVGTFKGATKKKILLASLKNATKKKPCCAGKKGGCKKPAKKKR